MKVYLSRSQSRALAAEYPVGDPTGGAAYGEYNDPGLIMGGASVVGGLLQADAAGDAANAQSAAAARSDATQRYMYDTTRADNAPFRDSGVAANNRLAYLLGLIPGGAGGQVKTAEQFREQFLPQYSKAAVAASGGGYVRDPHFNDEVMWQAGTPGTPASVDETGLQAAIQRAMAEQEAAQKSRDSDPQYGSLLRNFSAADLAADPVYNSGLQFGLDEGRKGIERQAAASGQQLSGATLKALARYGTDYASTKANESFNRFNTNQDRTYNKLAGLSGAGQQATNQVSAAGQNMANNISASQQGVGNARAASSIGGTNALVGAMNQGLSSYYGNQPGGNYNSWLGNNTGVMNTNNLTPDEIWSAFK